MWRRASRRWRWAAGLLLVVALIARLGLIVAEPDFRPYGDQIDFDGHAVAIAQTGHYPVSGLTGRGAGAVRPPAYPYLLGAAYAVTGTADTTARYKVGRVLGALLGVATVALIGMIAGMLWGPTPALCALGISAVYPPLVATGDWLLSEALFTPLVLASVASVLLQRQAPRGYSWAAVAGVAMGLALLTRTNVVAILPALLLGLWVLDRPRRIRAAGVLLATALAVTLPWIVRDAVAFDRFVPISTQAGYTLAGTYNEVSRSDPVNPAAWRVPDMPPYVRELRHPPANEAELDQRLQDLVFEYIGDHPTYLAKVAFWNTARLLELTGHAHERYLAREVGIGAGYADVARYSFWAVLLLALGGIVASQRAQRTPLFLWAIPPLLCISVLMVLATARYREPADSFLIVAASLPVSYAVGWALRRLGLSRRVGLATSGSSGDD